MKTTKSNKEKNFKEASRELEEKQDELDFIAARVWQLLDKHGVELPEGALEEDAHKIVFSPDRMEIFITERFYTKVINGDIYRYDKNTGIYKDDGEEKARMLLEKFCPTATRHQKLEVISKLVDRNRTDPKKLNLPQFLVVKNGVLDIEARTLKPHSPDVLATQLLPINYNPEAECPIIKKFHSEIVSEEDVLLLPEILGLCLNRRYSFHKFFIFLGAGANGKTTLVNLWFRFLNADNCSTVLLQQLTGRFNSIELRGKLANIADDLPNYALKNTGTIKMLTGESMVHADRKYKDPISFYSYAVLIAACNQLPEAKGDSSPAWWSRVRVVHFPNTFIGKTDDKKLAEKLATEEELSGLLNLALEGLDRLKENGEFSGEQDIDTVREEYERLANPIKAFADVALIPGVEIKKGELYLELAEYCRARKFPVPSKYEVGVKLPEYIACSTRRAHGSVLFWTGITWNPEYKTAENSVQATLNSSDDGACGSVVKHLSYISAKKEQKILYKRSVTAPSHTDNSKVVKIMFLDTTPIFKGPDGKSYGPFKISDVAEVPEACLATLSYSLVEPGEDKNERNKGVKGAHK